MPKARVRAGGRSNPKPELQGNGSGKRREADRRRPLQTSNTTRRHANPPSPPPPQDPGLCPRRSRSSTRARAAFKTRRSASTRTAFCCCTAASVSIRSCCATSPPTKGPVAQCTCPARPASPPPMHRPWHVPQDEGGGGAGRGRCKGHHRCRVFAKQLSKWPAAAPRDSGAAGEPGPLGFTALASRSPLERPGACRAVCRTGARRRRPGT